MKSKMMQMIVLAGVTAVSSFANADDSMLRVVVPMPPPTSRPSDIDVSAVSEAQKLFDSARKEAVAAHADLIKAQTALTRITASLQSQAETDSALRDAADALSAAKAAREVLVQPILASLADGSPCREALAALSKAQQTADQLRIRPQASIEDRAAAAQAVLDAKVAVAQLENAALESNPEVVAANKSCLEASQRLKQLRAQLFQGIHQDQAYIAASKAVDDARERASAADQQLSLARQDMFTAQKRLADKLDSRQQVLYWTYTHGLPDPP
jgi:hypothetical protein